jgi:hypothetical protein
MYRAVRTIAAATTLTAAALVGFAGVTQLLPQAAG